ncbi:hypothetical protein ACIQOW_31140 [Kitasatospora sp. NPDC091335]|uniref:hypothetical protein n=1 Tax=Kitasatospora sp. NPDC091335 TaxID=3364085 RepID=UPI0037FDD012
MHLTAKERPGPAVAEATDLLHGRFGADTADFGRARTRVLGMVGMPSRGIIEQFPGAFGQ